jgi:hypothetical protein
MIMKPDNFYPLKHWITSIIVGATYYIFHYVGIEIIFAAAIMGLLLSLPVLIIYQLCFRFLVRSTDSPLIIKTVLNLIAAGGVFLTVNLIGGTEMTSTLAFYYSITIIICSLFFKIFRYNRKEETRILPEQ